MEERAIEEKEKGEARDKVRATLARASKAAVQMADPNIDLSDTPPHLLGH
jgi:hypothetical protein